MTRSESTSATQDVISVTQDMMRSGQKAVKTSINTYRNGSGRLLSKCDDYVAGYVGARPYGMPRLISAELKGDLIGAQTELTARIGELANKVAERVDETTDKLAHKTVEGIGKVGEVVDKFEEVFDTRVLHSLGRISMPAVRIASELVGKLADVSAKIEQKVGEPKHDPATAAQPHEHATGARRTSKSKRKVKVAA